MNRGLALTGLPGGLHQFGPIVSIPAYSNPTAGAWTSANRMWVRAFRVGAPVAVTQATWFVGASAGNVSAGVGTLSGTTFTLLGTTGTVAAAGSSATQTAALDVTARLQPGVTYAMCMSVSTVTTLTVGRIAPFEAIMVAEGLTYFVNSTFPVASATVAAGFGGGNFMPLLVLS